VRGGGGEGLAGLVTASEPMPISKIPSSSAFKGE
jgi:hypothetical protein